MKYGYFFLILFLTLSINSFSQTHTWTGSGDDYFWSDPQNWDQGTIPLVNGVGTVIIPEGVEVHSTSLINFEYGEFTGGGTLINNGVINLINSDEVLTSKVFSDITILSSADLNIYRANGISNTDPILLNEGSHIIAGYQSSFGFLTTDGIGISFNTAQPGFLEINGDFTKTGSEDILIDVELKICCYNFLVSEGKLTIDSATVNTVLGPYFDIPTGSTLILKGNTIFAGNGSSVSGNIQGLLEITDSPTKNPIVTGTFFFDAEGEITFNNATFQGNGTFHGRVNTFIPENSTVIFEGFRFSNQRVMKMNATSTIVLKSDGKLSNSPSSIIELNGGNIIGINNEEFINAGIINLSNGTNFNTHNILLINSGIINIQDGNFIMDDNSYFDNYYELEQNPDFPEIIYEYFGEVIGSGNFRFPAYNPQSVNNNAIFSPELGISTLNTENFSQTSTGFVKIEIENLTSFDKIINTGTTYFEGGFEVSLIDYSPIIGDEFIVYQSDNSLTNCSAEPTTTTTYNNQNYIFDVICNDDNITLKLGEILAVSSFEQNDYSFYNYPNPVINETTFVFSSEENSSQNHTIIIYNIFGQVVREMNINNGENLVFRRANLSSGVYFAKLKSNDITLATTKLIIK